MSESTPEPRQLAELATELATELQKALHRHADSPMKTTEELKRVVLDLDKTAAALRQLPEDAFHGLAVRGLDVGDTARQLQSLMLELRAAGPGLLATELEPWLNRSGLETRRLLGTLSSYWPAPGGPGTVPLIKVHCRVPGCTRSGVKRSHSDPAPLCPDHNLPMS
jgi:hypothetical protein